MTESWVHDVQERVRRTVDKAVHGELAAAEAHERAAAQHEAVARHHEELGRVQTGPLGERATELADAEHRRAAHARARAQAVRDRLRDEGYLPDA